MGAGLPCFRRQPILLVRVRDPVANLLIAHPSLAAGIVAMGMKVF
jgi:hypothetical protein